MPAWPSPKNTGPVPRSSLSFETACLPRSLWQTKPVPASSLTQGDFFTDPEAAKSSKVSNRKPGQVLEELIAFSEFGSETLEQALEIAGLRVPLLVNEFWTSRQRQAHSLHEVSYRACFKPQLPRFFIDRYTAPGDLVYDPFMGRGTTCLEAALLSRRPAGTDANPLSRMLVRPRLTPPTQAEVEHRLEKIGLTTNKSLPEDLLVFYHPETLRGLVALRDYFLEAVENKSFDHIDGWLRMVAINRLTGHSPGFFSVYTLPPNQAVSVKAQQKINRDRNQTPPERDLKKIILKKSRQLLGDLDPATRITLTEAGLHSIISTGQASANPLLEDNSVSLIVTSPPFLDVVDYSTDNWLRCWFAGFDSKSVQLTVMKSLDDWRAAMTEVFRDLGRVLKPGGHIAFEVGEVRAGKIRLEETVVLCGTAVGLVPEYILINQQEFTKTANCWGVDNNSKGTNSNRVVVFRKDKARSRRSS